MPPSPKEAETVTVQLTRIELAGVLAATNAVADAAPGAPEPLITAGEKLHTALTANQQTKGER
jgi:hypothetical protein